LLTIKSRAIKGAAFFIPPRPKTTLYQWIKQERLRFRVLKFFYFCLCAVRCTSHGSHLIPYPQYAIRHTLYEFIYVFAIPFRRQPHKSVNIHNNSYTSNI